MTSCGNGQNENVILEKTDRSETESNEIRYTDEQLERFLDSIGHLSPLLWADKVAFTADSTFKNQTQKCV